ncbi:MAG: precorrin-2 dehydrogenase/sirohydrochlorin ferrochelatase family protein [Ilumatobacteraceae bacterium]
MAFGFPIMLDLTDVPVLVVGGGNIASRKAAQLLDAGALVTVVAPYVQDRLAERAAVVHRRPYEAADIAGHRLVMTATDVPAVNAQVAHDAKAAGIWVNSADDPENCTFILPAVTRQGPVVVSVGTDGSSPALARHLRDRIANEIVTPGIADVAAELARQRAEFHAQGISTETVDWTDRLADALDRFS